MLGVLFNFAFRRAFEFTLVFRQKKEEVYFGSKDVPHGIGPRPF